MYIKNRRNGIRTVFVFYFKDEEEFRNFLKILEMKIQDEDEEKEEGRKLIEKFRSRVDGKYKSEDSELSGCLFMDEFVMYAQIFSVI